MAEAAMSVAPAESPAAARLPSATTVDRGEMPSAARFLSAVLDEVRADRWLYAWMALYVVSVGAVAAVLGEGRDFLPFLYLVDGIEASFGVLMPIVLMLYGGIGAIRRPDAPFAGFGEALLRAINPRFFAGFLLLCAIFVFYGSFTSAKNLLPDVSRFEWDVWLANAGRLLHGGRDPATVLSEVIGRSATLALDFVYGKIWFIALLGISTWAALTGRHAHLRVQFFLTLMVCWVVLGNVLAAIFLSGGPIYYDELTSDHSRFVALGQSLNGTSSQEYANYLWALAQHKVVGIGTGISAFPSMHISICVLLTIYVGTVDRRLGALAVVYTAIMLVGSVRLGWHYTLDGYASIVLTPIAWRAVAWARSRPLTLDTGGLGLAAQASNEASG